MATNKRSGPNVRNAQRHTRAMALRLPPDVDAEIRATAAASGVQVSTLVALAWATARRSGGLDAALAVIARADSELRRRGLTHPGGA